VSSGLPDASPTVSDQTLTQPSEPYLLPLNPRSPISKSYPNPSSSQTRLPDNPVDPNSQSYPNPSHLSLEPTFQESPIISSLRLNNLVVFNGPSYLFLGDTKAVNFPDMPKLISKPSESENLSDGRRQEVETLVDLPKAVHDDVAKMRAPEDDSEIKKSSGPEVLADYFRSRLSYYLR